MLRQESPLLPASVRDHLGHDDRIRWGLLDSGVRTKGLGYRGGNDLELLTNLVRVEADCPESWQLGADEHSATDQVSDGPGCALQHLSGLFLRDETHDELLMVKRIRTPAVGPITARIRLA